MSAAPNEIWPGLRIGGRPRDRPQTGPSGLPHRQQDHCAQHRGRWWHLAQESAWPSRQASPDGRSGDRSTAVAMV